MNRMIDLCQLNDSHPALRQSSTGAYAHLPKGGEERSGGVPSHKMGGEVGTSQYRRVSLPLLSGGVAHCARVGKALIALLFLLCGGVASAQVQVDGSVYGGGNLEAVSGNTTVILNQAGAVVTNDVYGGGAFANVGTNNSNTTTVYLLQGTVSRDVYGGGLGDTITLGEGHSNVAALVKGVVHLNIGAAADATEVNATGSIIGEATIGRSVYGCNNFNGSPQDDVFVNIYKTAHVAANTYPAPIPTLEQLATPAASTAFALKTVYGGGNQAAYAPENGLASSTKTAQVHVYTCANTIQTVYGGGNAADATKVHTIIDGGRFDRVFGGGNGYSETNNHLDPTALNYNPGADITISATTEIHGGLYRQVFSGSNQYGNVASASLTIDKNTCGDERIAEAFGGANEAPISGNLTTTLACGNADSIGSFYGGSNLADIAGNVTLNVFGGTYINVFGGSKGTNPPANATDGQKDTASADITGDVTLNLFGGSMTNAFGGSDVYGKIDGKITVNMYDKEASGCGLTVHNIYGGGRDAAYTPITPGAYPEVNLINGTVSTYVENAETKGGNVFGGGLGETAVVASNPTVRVGYDPTSMSTLVSDLATLAGTTFTKAVVTVAGDVYGGGEEAAVVGNTSVTVQQGTVAEKTITTTVNGDVYGGGALAEVGKVGTSTHTVTLTGGTVRNLYGGGLGDKESLGGGHSDVEAVVKGDVTVTVEGGTVPNVYGCNNVNGTPQGAVEVNIRNNVTNNVFGGGNLATATCSPVVNINSGAVDKVFGGGNEAGVASTTVNVTGGTITSGVYGGCNTSGTVTGTALVNLDGGTVGASGSVGNLVFGGGYGHGTTTNTAIVNVGTATTTGEPPTTTYTGSATIYSNVYGGSALGAVGTDTVNLNGATTLTGHVFGGGMGSGTGNDTKATVTTAATVFQNNITMAADKNIYGGCNVNGTAATTSVYVMGGASKKVFGGGYGEYTDVTDDVLVSIGMDDKGTISTASFSTVDVYGGSALGTVNTNTDNTTVVNVMAGNVTGNVYGGGMGQSGVDNVGKGQVNGTVTVNIGRDNAGTPEGTATFGETSSVYGCNNVNGSPRGDVTVNVYQTGHNTTNAASYLENDGHGAPTYAIDQVFGGGRNADYSISYKAVTVNIFTCDNTIRRVFGGGDAAAVTGSNVTINGGRFDYLFGGGNGETTAANIGSKGITIALHGGTINHVVNGSNTSGTIDGPVSVTVDNTGCGQNVNEFFGGSNAVDIGTNDEPVTVVTTIECGAGTFNAVYGGSNQANIIGNVTLNIKGGTIGRVFGGSKGVIGVGTYGNPGYVAPVSADIKDVSGGTGVYGNVALNLYGGTIGAAFGGSNLNGSIDGTITVTVNDLGGSCPLVVDSVFGAGNLTAYTAPGATPGNYPVVNINHGTVGRLSLNATEQADTVGKTNVQKEAYMADWEKRIGMVFGGGKGETAVVTGNPRVNIGDSTDNHVVNVTSSVFGGGDAAHVDGSPTVTFYAKTTYSSVGKLFGGGNNIDGTNKGISGNTHVILKGEGVVAQGIYGGCNEDGTVVGNSTVDLLGGHVGTPSDSAFVFGGGFGQNTEVKGDVHVTLGNLAGTATPEVYGELYGGSALGTVNVSGGTKTTTVYLLSGTFTGNIFGGGLGQKTGINGTSDIAADVYGKVYVNVGTDGSPYTGLADLRGASIFGCNNINGTPKQDVNINVYKTKHTETDSVNVTEGGTYAISAIYGGGFRADYTPADSLIRDTTGLNIPNDSIARNYFRKTHIWIHGCFNTVRRVFGGGNAAAVPGDSVVIDGGRYHEVFGGGNGALRAANVDKGGVFLIAKGGRVGYIYEHCNKRGAVTGAVTLVKGTGNGSDCSNGQLRVLNHYCGGNEVDVCGDATHTFTCGQLDENTHTSINYDNLYGGCRMGSHYGNITLTIEGGTFGNIFGGPQGDDDIEAWVRRYPTLAELQADSIDGNSDGKWDTIKPEGERQLSWEVHHYMKKHPELRCNPATGNCGGNVTIILHGGTIGNVYGGCDYNGSVEGRITIIVDSTDNSDGETIVDECALEVNNIYGGGNRAVYTPDTAATNPNYAYPFIDLRNGHVNNSVYGGGRGLVNSLTAGLVTSNPYIKMTPDVANSKKFLVKKDLYGGGELGPVRGSTKIDIADGSTINGTVYGGGKGHSSHVNFGLVTKNTHVTMTGGYVFNGIFGGGMAGSVGTFTRSTAEADANVFGHTSHSNCVGKPMTCTEGTGKCTVEVTGGQIGPVTVATIGMDPNYTHGGPVTAGWVWGGSCGLVEDPATHFDVHFSAYVGSTDVTIGGTAFVMEGVIGGGEFGRVLGNTLVKIQDNCQIGVGAGQTETVGGVLKPKRYSDAQWTAAENAVKSGNASAIEAAAAGMTECSHFDYGGDFLTYDPYFKEFSSPTAFAPASTDHPSNGYTWIGVVFGGGSGYMPYRKDDGTGYDWFRSAGWVEGNTEVRMSGGHVLTNVYGGNEMTDVKDTAIVTMTGGTIGVPRTLAQIAAHPVTCYLFGAGKGDERTHFNTFTNVGSAVVTVKGGIVYGSVFGGGEDGHVLGDAIVKIEHGAHIGTWGTSYVDGNVFGGGRGFSGIALTAGTVGGNTSVYINGGTMLGSVYGGGRMASVGTEFVFPDDVAHYGHMQDGDDHGIVTITIKDTVISGTTYHPTIGNTYEYTYIAPSVTGSDLTTAKANMPNTLHAEAAQVTAYRIPLNRLLHTKGGNVFGGSMGRLDSLAGGELWLWPRLAKVKNTYVNISGGIIKSNVYGGGEMGTLTGNSQVNISGGTIGTVIAEGTENEYKFGNVYGGGFGSNSTVSNNDSTEAWTALTGHSFSADVHCGRVYGDATVNLTAGTIRGEVYGGGEMASLGYEIDHGFGNTTVNIGASTGTAPDTTISGNVLIEGRKVYGANNFFGTPLGNANVNVYKLHRTAAQEVGGDEYSLEAVFGGGHNANYLPNVTVPSKRTQVHVYTCNNTIEKIFGGGDAAEAYGAGVTIDGGRFDSIFGGGNGTEVAANIGAGGTQTVINSGTIDHLFGGSNMKGSLNGPVSTVITNSGACGEGGEAINEFYAGSNLADIVGDLTTTIECSDPAVNLTTVYGGCKQADIYGSVNLTINGGTYMKVYGGSMGVTPANNATQEQIDLAAADIKRFDAQHLPAGRAVGQGGNVNLTINGGTITDVFGGSNVFGNIEGKVTVEINHEGTSCAAPAISHNVYGGGNLATNKAVDGTLVTPDVRLVSGTVGNDVFGGGKGIDTDTTKGVTTNSSVSMTGSDFTVTNNIYGGGEVAHVDKDAHVSISNGLVGGSVFGGGKGLLSNAQLACVKGNTQVDISGGKITFSVYGGGEMSSVGIVTDSTEKHTDETSSFALSWPYKFVYAPNTGTATVNVTGGRIGVTGKDIINGSSEKLDNGDIYGGGKGIAADRYVEAHYANVNNTVVTVNISSEATAANYKENGLNGYACITGALYGGGENGHVNNNTSITITNGLIGHAVYGGGKGKDTYETGELWKRSTDITTDPKPPYDSTATIYSVTAGKVYGNTNIVMTGGTVVRSIFGGGNLASVGKGNYASADDDYYPGGYGEKVTAFTPSTSTDTANTGHCYITITGGTVGCLDPAKPSNSIKENIPYGSVFGGCRGTCTRDVPRNLSPRFRYCPEDYLGYVNKTYVTIGDGTQSPRLHGSVYGGGQDGHVRWTTYVRVLSGEIGEPYTNATAATALVGSSDLNSPHWLHRGNVYGGGSGLGTVEVNGVPTYSYISGSVTHFTRVDIEGGTIHRNVYGGGSLATVGPPKIKQPDEAAKSLTLTQVNISGGSIGTLADASGFYTVHHDAVGTQGDPGYVAAYDDSVYYSYGGNVFGGSRGELDVDNSNFSTVNYSEVNVSGGHVYASVYGGGEIGTIKKDADVNITGGTIGDSSQYVVHSTLNPLIASDSVARFFNDSLPDRLDVGHVYGGGKGISADVAGTYKTTCNVQNTDVDVSGTARIFGSVYGGAADGHVKGSTDVTISGGTIGTLGLSSWDGHVFGGGQGSGTVSDEDEFTLCATCGNVMGNTSVTMTGGTLKGTIYGGGRLALTGVDADGDYSTYVATDIYDSASHGNAIVAVSGGTIGNSDGTALEASDFSLGDIFGSGRGDVEWYQSVEAGRVANTIVTISGTPTIYGAVFGGGEMAGIGWWVVDPGNANHGKFAGKTGTSHVNVSGGTIGLPYEYSPAYLANPGDWTVVTDGRLSHACTGNIIGGSQGDVDLLSPAWISMGRSRQTFVDISGTPVIMGNVYGGAEQGVVTENTRVTVSGGTIGQFIPSGDTTLTIPGDTVFKKDNEDHFILVNDKKVVDSTHTVFDTLAHHYAFGSVFGGGYGSERWWDTARDESGTLVHRYNDSCRFSSTTHSLGTMTHYASPTLIAGRVYGNTTVIVSGGTIHDCVYGGGNMASVGYINRYYDNDDHTVKEILSDSTKWHQGICNVTITNTVASAAYAAEHDGVSAGDVIAIPLIGPLDSDIDHDHKELSACVYGAGKGVGNDVHGYFARYCNVDSTRVIVNGGRIYRSVFGGGADCHVLGSTNTLVEAGAIIGSGQRVNTLRGYDGYEEEYDGCVIGGGRNAFNRNCTAGRVQGNTNVRVTGGRIQRSVIGGGALARTGVDVNGKIDSLMVAGVYDSTHHGSTFVDVSGTTTSMPKATFEASPYYDIFSGTVYDDESVSGNIILSYTTIGAPDGSILVDNDYTIGDIFGGGKGDTKDTVDIMAGRVMNTHVNVHGSPRIMADIYAGAEMASVGWWDTNRYVTTYGDPNDKNPNHDIYYDNTGYTKVVIKDSPYTGTPYEFSTRNYVENRRPWTLIDSLGRLTHTCSGNVYGGGQGYVEQDGTHYWNWVHMGRVRYTTVSIAGGHFMGNVFGGGSRGVVKENCNVTITGGTIGCIITDEYNYGKTNKYLNYYYGSVFGGGYGNPKTFRHINDSSFVCDSGRVSMIPTEQAGRVYDTTYVKISGGHIYGCVYGGGDLASTGWVDRDSHTGRYLFEDKTKRHGGVCNVEITGSAIIGPLDLNGHNAHVYGAGKGMDVDVDEVYKLCGNVNEAHVTVNLGPSGRIYGSLFGGGADCHVLGDVETILHGGLVGTDGTTSYDGNIFGGGRNYHNSNHTNGRVAGNVKVLMDGGHLMGSIFGGGRLAMTGVDVDGHYIDSDHGNVDIQVRGNAILGTDNSADLLGAYESCGDIFGAGKGDTKEYVDIWAGRVTNAKITVEDSPSSSPRIYGGVFGGGEMASLGYWDDTIRDGNTVVFHTKDDVSGTYGTNYGVFYSNTGKAIINITGGVTIGTEDEFIKYTRPKHEDQSERDYLQPPYENPGVWTMYDASGKLFHTATGNVYGGCQGDVDRSAPRWVSMGRSRTSEVTIGTLDAAGPTIKGCVFGGAEQGIMTEGTLVIINSGTIGTVTSVGSASPYVYGDVYAAGYGSDDTVDDLSTYRYISQIDTTYDSNGEIESIDTTYGTAWAVNDSTLTRRALSTTLGLTGADTLSSKPSALAGRVFGDVRVDVLGGTIKGDVYGGGSFAPVGFEKSSAIGNTLVNIGSGTVNQTTGFAESVSGNATIKGQVFGANNFAGSPYGNTEVNIYSTAHTTDEVLTVSGIDVVRGDEYPFNLKQLEEPTTELTDEDIASSKLSREDRQNLVKDSRYALAAVYGGGNLAAHTPASDDGTTLVHVYYCEENTIKFLYGGGNAAATRNNHVIVDGGRVKMCFGGGDGYSETGNHTRPYILGTLSDWGDSIPDPYYNPGADVLGIATTEIHGGVFDSVYAGSNQKGYVQHSSLTIDNTSGCEELISNSFGGGNEAEGGGGEITLHCGARYHNFYAGANNADIGTMEDWLANPQRKSNIVLNVEGGVYENLFGGNNAGGTIYGDVTVNIHGGHIKNLFGGNNAGGNILGSIVVNVDFDPDYTCADGLRLDTIYGGGKNAAYTPYDPFHASPAINVKNNRVKLPDSPTTAFTDYTERIGTSDSAFVKIQDVFGGGLGATARVTSYPRIVVGGFQPETEITIPDDPATPEDETVITTLYTREARVYHNLYGGGSAAPVSGNTTVFVSDAVIGTTTNHDHPDGGMIFGGGYGATSTVHGNTVIGIYGLSDIKNNVYGGGNAGVIRGRTHTEVAFNKQPFPPEIEAFPVTDGSGLHVMANLIIRGMETVENKKFYYTTDGSKPNITDNTQLWDGEPFELHYGEPVHCIATIPGYIPSAMMTPMMPAPEIIFHEGRNGARDTVTFTGTVGSRIRYTLNGSEPVSAVAENEGSPVYCTVGETEGSPVVLATGQTVKAIAEGKGCEPSPAIYLTATAPTITILPRNGTGNATDHDTIRITAPHTKDHLIYTLDGTTPISTMGVDPTSNPELHGTHVDDSNTVDLVVGVDIIPGTTPGVPTSGDFTVKALTEHQGYMPSSVTTVNYTPTP